MSTFKRKNKKIIAQHLDELVKHLTGMPSTDDNFGIATSFAKERFDNNSFPDPNEHLVHK